MSDAVKNMTALFKFMTGKPISKEGEARRKTPKISTPDEAEIARRKAMFQKKSTSKTELSVHLAQNA